MNCPRCGGMMINEWVADLVNPRQEDNYRMGRCLACGEMIDPLILKNRKAVETSHSN